MYRVRTIIPEKNKGVFYNIEDLLPFLEISKDKMDEIIKFAKDMCEQSKFDGFIFPQKMFDKYTYTEQIHGKNGVQEHFYFHLNFFKYFYSADYNTVKKILEGED